MFFHPVLIYLIFYYSLFRNLFTLTGDNLLMKSLIMQFKVVQLIPEEGYMKILFYLVVAQCLRILAKDLIIQFKIE
jgi:hypothetical protein